MIGAVDIGGTKVALGLATESGRLVCGRELPAPPLCCAGVRGLCEVRDALAGMAREAGCALRGVGIGCTGPVDPASGRIGHVATIRGWNGLNLVEAFSSLGVPVAVENDADAGALGEAAWGAGRGADRLAYVTVGTGIGGGMVLGGQLYRGAGGAHPEVGHHILEWGGEPCYCGARGCWEAMASGPAMAAEFARETGRDGRTARDICDLARGGDQAALRAVGREARYLGLGLVNLITLFVPGVIALGGGLMKSWDLFEQRAAEIVRQYCTQVPAAVTRIVPAGLGADLPLLGAARVWIQRYCGGRILLCDPNNGKCSKPRPSGAARPVRRSR
ncbi:MAG: ROK family protein [Acidobacteria bacterium]|nr:ROK family protein [Acidobacteriota bacterium]